MKTLSYRTLRTAFTKAIADIMRTSSAPDGQIDIALALEHMRKNGIDLDALPTHPYDRYYSALGFEKYFDEVIEASGDPIPELLRLPSSDDAMIGLVTAAFVSNGKNTFKVTPDLYAMFQRTDLKGVETSFIPPPPFRCFYIDITGCGLWFCRPTDGAPVQANGVYVVNEQSPDEEVVNVRFVVWAKESPVFETLATADDVGEEALAMARETMQAKKSVAPPERVDSWADAHLISGLQYSTREGSQLHILLDEVKDKSKQSMSRNYGSEFNLGLQVGALHDALMLIFNLLLFLGTDPNLMLDEHAAERRKLLKMYAAGTNGKSITPGARRAHQRLMEISSTNVRLLSSPARITSKTSSENSGVRLHWVRGHWRRQPYGPRDEPQYKMIWIQPHQKGDAGSGAIKGKTYSW